MLPGTAETEDIAQETFIRLWASRARFEDPRQVVVWLYRTSTRLAVDRLRRGRVRQSAADALSPPAAGPAGSPDAAFQSRELLAHLAARLSAGELELALLWHVDRMSQPEIALVLQSSERTIRRKLARLSSRLEQLRKELAP